MSPAVRSDAIAAPGRAGSRRPPAGLYGARQGHWAGISPMGRFPVTSGRLAMTLFVENCRQVKPLA